MIKLKRVRKRIKNWFIYILTKFGYTFLCGTNRITAFKFLGTLGKLGYYLVISERKKTIEHLTLIYGDRYSASEIKAMARAVFLNLGRNMVDAFRVSKLNPENIATIVKSKGLEKIDHALSKGRGVLLLTGHIGNWELLAAYVSLSGYILTVIGRPVYDPRLDEMVIQNRMSSGARYVARGGATREILRALKRNEAIGILIDQDSKRNEGVFVDFMGHDAYTAVGPVILAEKTGAPLVPVAIHILRDNTHFVEVGDEIQLKLTGNKEHDRIYNTQLCSKAIENFIHQNPTQWVWMHRRWRTKRKKDFIEVNE